MIKLKALLPSLLLALTLFLSGSAKAQKSVAQEKMAKLQFMVGDWIGTSTQIKEGQVASEIPAFEKISSKVDGHIITLDLFSESLQLHTVIYYDEKEQSYFYHPYSKRGTGKYKGEFVEGEFRVWFNESRRLIFHLTEKGEFQEYGEILKDGKWSKYFEDTFTINP